MNRPDLTSLVPLRRFKFPSKKGHMRTKIVLVHVPADLVTKA